MNKLKFAQVLAEPFFSHLQVVSYSMCLFTQRINVPDEAVM